MRGVDVSQPKLFVTRKVADFVPAHQRLRAMRVLIDEALQSLEGLFGDINSTVLAMARTSQLLSEEHSSIDVTLIEVWAAHKGLRRCDDDYNGGPVGRERDYHGERISNATHVSSTDPAAELMRKSES